jgi:hypothetical protein
MEFYYVLKPGLGRDTFPTRNSKGATNLNNPDAPHHPHKAMWFYPQNDDASDMWGRSERRNYTLKQDTKLYHVHNVDDYIQACNTFPIRVSSEEDPYYKFFKDDILEKIESTETEYKIAIQSEDKESSDFLQKRISLLRNRMESLTSGIPLSIDFNKMRSAGYEGLYFHESALDDATSISPDDEKYESAGMLSVWGTEAICVWSYCFTD